MGRESLDRAFRIAFLVCTCAAISARGMDRLADVLTVTERCVTDPCVGWPLEWRQEYLDTIRRALREGPGRPDHLVRIEIFARGFPVYWGDCQLSDLTGAGYEALKAEMRWYCETLMAGELASPSEKAMLKSQFRELCDYATEHLKGEFPFLTDVHVQAGKRAALRELDDKLDAPLLPIFRRPFSQDQLHRIKTNWARSYRRWFFVWRQVRYEAMLRGASSDPNTLTNHPQSQFVNQCLSYLPRVIWPVVERPPEYVVEATQALNEEKIAKTRAYAQTAQIERDLASRFSNRVEQVEQWGFVFTALFETATLYENPSPSSANPQKGGDAYEPTKQP